MGAVKEIYDLKRKIKLGTYNTDIEQFNKDYGADYLSSWHTADEINTYYDRLADLNERTKAYQTYINTYGTDEQKSSLENIGKQVNAYDEIIGARQDVLDYYGGFSSADEFKTAFEQYAEQQAADEEFFNTYDIEGAKVKLDKLEKQHKSPIQDPFGYIGDLGAYYGELDAEIRQLEDDISRWENIYNTKKYSQYTGTAEYNPAYSKYGNLYESVYSGHEIGPLNTYGDVFAEGKDKSKYQYLTEAEKKKFYSLWEQRGEKAASEYIDYLTPYLYSRSQEKRKANAKDSPFWYSVGSALEDIVIVPIEQIGRYVDYGLTGRMGYNLTAQEVETIQGAVSEEMGKFGSFLYGTATSGGTSLGAALVSKATAGPVGEVLLGLSAAAHAQNDIIARGGNSSQAALGGIAAGAFEALFEHMSISKLLNSDATDWVFSLKNVLRDLATSAGINATEEMFTEIANIAFDMVNMGELSNAALQYKELIDSGEEKSTAFWKALGKNIAQVVEAGASGALMGFGFSAIGGGVGVAKTDSAQRQLGKNQIKEGNVESLLTDAKELFKDAKYKDEQALIKKVEEGLGKKGPSQQRNVGKLTGRVISTKFRELNKQVAEKSIENVAETRKNVESETKKFKVNASSAEINYDNMPQILGFEGANLDKTMVETEQGAVKLTDMEISNAEIGDLYAYAVRLGNTESANAFIQNWDQTTDPVRYYYDWVKFQLRGRYAPESFDKTMAEYSNLELSERAKLAAFKSGVSLRAVKAQAEKKSNESAQIGQKQGKLHNNIAPKTEVQRASLKMLNTLAETLGIDVYVYESKEVNGKRDKDNGWFDPRDNSIHIDLYAGSNGEGTMLFTAAHELTHFVRRNIPAEFDAFADFLFSQYAEKGVTMDSLIEKKIKFLKKVGTITSNMTEAEAYDIAYEEVVADSCESFLADGSAAVRIAELKQTNNALWAKIKQFFTELVERIKAAYKQFRPNSAEGKFVAEMLDKAEQLKAMWTDLIVEASEVVNASGLTATEEVTLAENGIAVDETTGDVHKVRNSVRYSTANKDAQGNIIDLVTVGKKSFNTEAIAKLVSTATGRSIEDARKWVRSEMTIANLVMDNPEFLDFEPDDRYQGIKKNSDYPQGTVDLSNNCPKREEFTTMFDILQKRHPSKLFTAADVASMREILKKHGITVACGACFVEDRRQLLGEIADTYINMWKEAVENGTPLQKTNAEGKKIKLQVTAALAKQYGLTKGADIMATDKYIPTQYDLTTYEGFKLLEKNHPLVAMGFNRYNNSRGQQAGRLIEGRAEYNRQILGWSPNKVRTVNNNGGLRIFSFSDFEVVHLLDLVQVIIDCAAMGVKIQGYTKIPAFARLVRNTGIKLNRSLIPKGETGIKVVNGKEVLDIDLVEGINIEDENFLDESDNDNVGNIIIGINPKQIGIAMLDDFIDYIIPFHTNKSKDICRKLGVGEWNNYKESQHEKDIETGKASKHNVNIYTQVINKYHPTNKTEFVDAFLKECRSQKKVPRYPEFLYKEYKPDGSYSDEGGRFDYTYREGYHKLLVDFKMFDKEGNILPQGDIVPELDDAFMAELLNKEIERKKDYTFPQEVYDEIDRVFGNGDRVMYQKRIETPGASEVLSELFRDNPNLNGYADQRKELKSYQELLRSVKVNEQRIAEIDAEIKSLKSQRAQGGKGTRMAQLYEMRKTAENRVTEKKNRMFKMEATSLRNVVTRETARLLQERTEEERSLSRQKQKDIRENYARREYIKKIEQRAKGLQEALTKNSKDKHIPEPFKAVVADMITALDFSSKRKLKGKGETNKDVHIAEAFNKMARALNLQNIDGSKGDLQTFLEMCDIDDMFTKKFTKTAQEINDISLEFGKQSETVLRQMTSEQLREVNSLLYNLSIKISEVNRLIGNSLTNNANNLARDFVAEADEYTIAKKKSKVKEFLDIKNTTPYYFFKRLGKAFTALFNEFADGFDKEAALAYEIIDFTKKTYTAKEVKAWSEEVHEFKGANGRQLYLTVADIMYIYQLHKRGQGLKHIQGAGVEAKEVKGKKEDDKRTKRYLNSAQGVTLSPKILDEIIGTLTPRQIEVAEALQKFMSTECADWGNEISMKRFGIKQFLEKNYVPIYSSGNTLAKDGQSPNTNDTFSTLNMSFMQLVDENANNRILIKNAFDVFADHTTKMAKYNAFAVALLDMRKFLNYKVKYQTAEDLENGTFQTREVRALLEERFGTEYQEYINNFIKDVAGEGGQATRGSEFWTKFISKYKVAAVAANLRVVLLQPTSYFRVSAVMEHKYLLKELKDTPRLREAMQIMEKYSGIAKWKKLGYHDVNISKSIAEKIKHADTWADKTTEVAMKGAEWADKITWASIWLACESEVKDKNKALKSGNEAFYKAVALRFREIIYATQVVDSPLTKSDFMRGKDKHEIILASFMSEPTLSYNLLLDAYHEVEVAGKKRSALRQKISERQKQIQNLKEEMKRSGDSSIQHKIDVLTEDIAMLEKRLGVREITEEEKNHGVVAVRVNGRRIGRLVTAYVLSAIAQTAMESLVDALRDVGDDEDETFISAYLTNALDNIINELSPFYKIPVVKDILSTFHSAAREKYFSQPRMDMAVADRIGTAFNSFVHLLEGKYSTFKFVKDLLNVLGSISGLPLGNAYRIVKTIWNNTMEMFNDGSGRIE